MERKKISILIYTESFLGHTDALEYLKNVASFDAFEVNYLPILDDKKESDLATCKYKHIRERNIIYSVIEFENGSGCIGTHNRILHENFDSLTDNELNKLSEKIIIEGNTYAAPFDVVVVSDKWASKKTLPQDQVLSFSQIKEFIRLYMIGKKKFHITPNYYIDEFGYYIFRHKCLFKNFQCFWSANIQSLNEYNDALDNRLLQFSICLDKVNSLLWLKQNNITAMHLKYHISYLTLLSTGIFDNLAWIINNYYNLELDKKSRLSIDLRKDKFIKVVTTKSINIASFINSDNVLNKIDAIRELRDRIVHRDFVKTISSGNTKKISHNYLMVDVELKNKLINAGFPGSGFPFSDTTFVCVDIQEFTKFIADTVVYITDGLLEIVNNELFNGNKQIVIWKMLDFPCEPYIL